MTESRNDFLDLIRIAATSYTAPTTDKPTAIVALRDSASEEQARSLQRHILADLAAKGIIPKQTHIHPPVQSHSFHGQTRTLGREISIDVEPRDAPTVVAYLKDLEREVHQASPVRTPQRGKLPTP